MSRINDISADIAQLLDAAGRDDEQQTKRAVASLLRGGLTDLARLADAAEKIAVELEAIRMSKCP